MPKSQRKQKTYTGASDGAGGVGFGIPADYSGGGVIEAEPDPTIAEHNKEAKRMSKSKMAENILMPAAEKSYLPDLFKEYTQLPKDNRIRLRAEELETDFLAVAKGLETAEANLIRQKAAARALLTVAMEMADSIRRKLDEWSEVVNNLDGKAIPKKLADEVKSTIGNWEGRATQILEPFGLFLYQISIELADAFGFLSAFDIAGDEPFAPDHNYCLAIDEVDDAIAELETVAEFGGGEILADYTAQQQVFDAMQKQVEHTQEEIQRSLIANALDTPPTQKSNNRLLSETKPVGTTKDGVQQDNPYGRIPNYRLAIDASPRVCGNCRFFEGSQGVDGYCHAFDFTAKSNYVCDAWQARELTATHTTVRNEGDALASTQKGTSMRYATKDNEADDNYEQPIFTAPMIEKLGHPKEVPGKVPGSRIVVEETPIGHMQYEEDMNYSVPQKPDVNVAMTGTLRAARSEFLPGDAVYSRSLRTSGIIESCLVDDGIQVYGLKLIDTNGVAWGTGFSYGEDLQPRSNKAVKYASQKTVKPSIFRAIKADGQIEDMIQVIRTAYQALKAVCDQHGDLMAAPLSNKEVLTPLREQMLEVMENPMFQNVVTGPKRKYYRAMQAALVSVGAARQVLFEGYKAINKLRNEGTGTTKAQMRDVMLQAQTGAFDRVKQAMTCLSDSLTLPSATHGDPAPGIEDASTGYSDNLS